MLQQVLILKENIELRIQDHKDKVWEAKNSPDPETGKYYVPRLCLKVSPSNFYVSRKAFLKMMKTYFPEWNIYRTNDKGFFIEKEDGWSPSQPSAHAEWERRKIVKSFA